MCSDFIFLTKFNIVSVEVLDLAGGKDRIVFEFGLSDSRAVVRDNDHLSLTLSQRLESKFVT